MEHGEQFKDLLHPNERVLEHNFDFTLKMTRELMRDYGHFVENSRQKGDIKKLKVLSGID